MKNTVLKRTGSFIILCFSILLISSPAPASEINIQIDDNVISAGEKTDIKIKITAVMSDIKPLKVPTVNGLAIEQNNVATLYENNNGIIWKGVVITYSITGDKPGSYKIPSFIFEIKGKILKTAEVSLIVTAPSSGRGEKSDGKGYSSNTLSRDVVYSGEPVILRYFLIYRGLRSVEYKGIAQDGAPLFRGFAAREFRESIAQEIVKEPTGDFIKNHFISYILIPAETGNHKAGGGKLVISYMSGRSFLGMTEQYSLSFAPVKLSVLPLPEKGKPEGYHGDVGSFKLKAVYSIDPIDIFQEKTATVTVTGRGNLLTMTKPRPEKTEADVKIVIEEKDKRIDVVKNSLQGFKTYVFTIIPQKPGLVDLGRIRLASFNPETGKYETAFSEVIKFSAVGKKDDGKRDREKFKDDNDKHPAVNPVFFAFIILAIAGIIFLVYRERKRMKLLNRGIEMEKPGLVAEKEVPGRRQILEELHGSMKRGDAGTFTLLAGRLLSILYESGIVPGNAMPDAERIKEELNSFRYGGGALSREQMERIYQEISQLF